MGCGYNKQLKLAVELKIQSRVHSVDSAADFGVCTRVYGGAHNRLAGKPTVR